MGIAATRKPDRSISRRMMKTRDTFPFGSCCRSYLITGDDGCGRPCSPGGDVTEHCKKSYSTYCLSKCLSLLPPIMGVLKATGRGGARLALWCAIALCRYSRIVGDTVSWYAGASHRGSPTHHRGASSLVTRGSLHCVRRDILQW